MRPIERVRKREDRKAKQREQRELDAWDMRFYGCIAATLLVSFLAVVLVRVSA